MKEVESIYAPADVPNGSIDEYLNYYDEITLGSGRLMPFAGDQKIEHSGKVKMKPFLTR